MGHCFTFVIGVLCIIYISGQTTQKVCWDTTWYNDSGILSNRSNYEHQTVHVLNQICTSGSVIDARCKDDKGEPFSVARDDIVNLYNATCDLVNGLICHPYKNAHNATCPDFAIQYGCNCPPTTTTTTGSQTTPKVCWDTKWYNDSGILSNGSNYEHQTVKALNQICTSGSVIAAKCKDNKGEPFEHFKNDSASRYIATCNHVNGLICHPYKNNHNATCPDFAIQYGCNCPPTTTTGRTSTADMQGGGTKIVSSSVRTHGTTQGAIVSSTGTGNNSKGITTMKPGGRIERGSTPGKGGSGSTGSQATGSGTGPSASGQRNNHCRNNGETYKTSQSLVLLCMIVFKVYC